MGTITINSSTLNTQYNYKNDQIVINGNYQKDAKTGELQNINGSCYKPSPAGEMGEYIGNFNGNMRDGEMRYSLSEMSRTNSALVLDAIDEIEQFILEGNDDKKK